MTPLTSPKSVLFIRRDNIGDLVCTTPMIRGVRLAHPQARLCVLVNSYNSEVVRNNPDIDGIYVYEKEKHAGGRSRIRVYLENLSILRKIRAERYTVALGCGYSHSRRLERYTALTGAAHTIGYAKTGSARSRFSYTVPVPEPIEAVHEVEAMMRLAAPLGVAATPVPPLSVRPSADGAAQARRALDEAGLRGPLIALHISSRKPQNRWPKERWAELARLMLAEFKVSLMLLWSPGAAGNALHPGDDESAAWIAGRLGTGIYPCRTERLSELISALSLADAVVCLDGGAMHISAGLGKPIVTVWGSTDPGRWAPWGVKNVIVQKAGKDASLIEAAEVLSGFRKIAPHTLTRSGI